MTQGRIVFVAGQIGWNPTTNHFESNDLTAQIKQALRNIVTVLHSGGAEPWHIARMTWFITDKQAYLSARHEIGLVYREIIGRHYPAMSVVVVNALMEDKALVEIEATAVVPQQ
jgi:enamine deaminase RidA (YjgF/YER057c/UK114 family)